MFHNKNFLIILFNAFMVGLANQIFSLALPLIVYNLTNSSVEMSAIKAVQFIPNILLAFIIGALVDRANKRLTMLLAIIGQIMALFIIYQLFYLYLDASIIVYSAVFLLFLANYWYLNVQSTIVKTAIPKQNLLSANSKLAFINQFYTMAGPAISGFILVWVNPYYSLLIPIIMLVLCIPPTLLMQMTLEEKKPKKTIKALVLEGWKAFIKNKPLLHLSIIVIFTNAAEGVFYTNIIFYAKRILELTDSDIGIIFSAAGLGGILGSLITPWLRKKIKLGPLLFLAIFFLAITYIFSIYATTDYLLAFSVATQALFGTILSIGVWSFRQETTPSELMGRVAGITGSVFKLGMPLTIYGSGWLVQSSGTTMIFIILGVVTALCSLISLFDRLIIKQS